MSCSDRAEGLKRSAPINCASFKFGGECPLWVKSRHRRSFNRCPLYPQKRTSVRPDWLRAHLLGSAISRYTWIIPHLPSSIAPECPNVHFEELRCTVICSCPLHYGLRGNE